MANPMRKHEILGLFYQFLGATAIGIGIYVAVWYAIRPLYFRSLDQLPAGWDWAALALFFGIGAVLWSLGKIELKDVAPSGRAEIVKGSTKAVDKKLVMGLVIGLILGFGIAWAVIV